MIVFTNIWLVVRIIKQGSVSTALVRTAEAVTAVTLADIAVGASLY